MSDYNAPIHDMRFILKYLIGFDKVREIPGYEDASDDLVDAILEEASKLARDVLAPLNKVGDQQGSKLNIEDNSVSTPDGFKQAYQTYRDAGWNSLPFATEHGGQNMPWALAMAVGEMWQSANLSFGLNPLLTQGAIDAIDEYGSEEQKKAYLPKMVSGEWTGTMNLTEPQAGSDLAKIKAKAEKQSDGTYKITGQKIYITWGEHDFTDNIVHLVLARTPDAPEGTKGISLFIVPKFTLDENGNPKNRNDVKCVGLEHKLGIHASPTATMAYEGATGYLVGEENKGLLYMFKMMNNARIYVGIQGVGVAERSYQQAVSYASQRQQGNHVKTGQAVNIIDHPDVKRMLMTMKTQTDAVRALALLAGANMDLGASHPDAAIREKSARMAALLTPIVKGWGTEVGVEAASLNVQVHGGMGFIEETGAAQYYRDARILPIYEGTNGIQAKDLVFRKFLLENGKTALEFIAEMDVFLNSMDTSTESMKTIHDALKEGVDSLKSANLALFKAGADGDTDSVEAVSFNYLKLFGIVAGGYMLARAADIANKPNDFDNDEYLKNKIIGAQFYAEQILPTSKSLAVTIKNAPKTSKTLDSYKFG